jgi:multiple sugar transport system ATP-binding protein
MGDRIVVMKDGLIQQVATPLELYDHPVNLFVAGFIGSPPMNFFNGRIEPRAGRLHFNEGSFSVEVDDLHAAKLSGRAGRDVVFGVRPEDLQDALFVSSPNPEHQIRAKVEVVEPMGSEVYLYLNTGRHTFIARVDVCDTADVNQQLALVVDVKKVHFFDPASGETII